MTQPGDHDDRTITTPPLSSWPNCASQDQPSPNPSVRQPLSSNSGIERSPVQFSMPSGRSASLRRESTISSWGAVYDSIRGIATAVGSALTERE